MKCPRCARLEPDDLSDLELPPELPVDDVERVAVLIEETSALPAAPCTCERPIVAVDPEGDARCWLCGHGPNGAHP